MPHECERVAHPRRSGDPRRSLFVWRGPIARPLARMRTNLVAFVLRLRRNVVLSCAQAHGDGGLGLEPTATPKLFVNQPLLFGGDPPRDPDLLDLAEAPFDGLLLTGVVGVAGDPREGPDELLEVRCVVHAAFHVFSARSSSNPPIQPGSTHCSWRRSGSPSGSATSPDWSFTAPPRFLTASILFTSWTPAPLPYCGAAGAHLGRGEIVRGPARGPAKQRRVPKPASKGLFGIAR